MLKKQIDILSVDIKDNIEIIKKTKEYDIDMYNEILTHFALIKRLKFTLFSYLNEILENEYPLPYRGKINFDTHRFSYILKIKSIDLQKDTIRDSISSDDKKKMIIDEILKSPQELLKKIKEYKIFQTNKYKNGVNEVTDFLMELLSLNNIVDKVKVNKLRKKLIPCINLKKTDVVLYYQSLNPVMKFLDFCHKAFRLITKEKMELFSRIIKDGEFSNDVDFVNKFIFDTLDNEYDNSKNQLPILKTLFKLQIHNDIEYDIPLCPSHIDLAYDILQDLYGIQLKNNSTINHYINLMEKSDNLNNFCMYGNHVVDKYGFEMYSLKDKKEKKSLEDMLENSSDLDHFSLDIIIADSLIFYTTITNEILNIPTIKTNYS